MAFTSPAMQLEFWTELATPLTTRGLRAPAPSERNHCYVGIGTSLGKLVLTAPTAKGGVACKLALKRSGRGGVEAARAIHQRLESEHLAIEQELGFHDLDWGSRESDTRVYRYRSCDLSARSEWPAAHAWLAQTAAAFACVFGQRLRSFGEQPGADEPVRRSLRSGRDLRAEGGSRDAATGATHINGATARRRTSIGWRDIGAGRWVDERLRGLARDPELELRTGSFPNGDRWSGVYSTEDPEPDYRYAFGQWWGEPSLSSSVAWILLNPATGDTDGRARPVRSYCRNRSREWGFTGFVIVNLFAYRHRDRTRLRETSAVGPFNDDALEIVTSACPQTVAAWGADGANWERAHVVRRRLQGELYCLPKAGRTLTAGGQPFYPRGLPITATPVLLPPGA
jgi:hypothetical protein